MTPLIKKLITFLVLAPIIFFGSIYAFAFIGYEWQQRRIYPFSHFNIYQENNLIKVFSPGDGSGIIIQNINHNSKRIIFTLTGSDQEIKSINIFSLNGLIGYDMCYENKYGQHCFGKTK